MTLKDIFTMIKADRYTADGCAEIKKAQKNEVEDVKYNIGDISQKTGLQKTANGWVKPKKGAAKKAGPNMNAEAEKHAEARKDRESAGAKQKLSENYKEEVKEFVSSATPERVQRYIKALRTPFSIERDNFEEPDKLAEALETELKQKTESKPADTPSYWIQDPRGNRLTNGDAIERIKTNKKEIERLKASGEPRADMKIRDLTNMNEYLSERLKPEDRKETEESKPAEPKHTLEVGSEVKFKGSGQPITIKNIEQYGDTKVVVGEYEHNGKKETNRFRLDELDYEEKQPEQKKDDNPIAEGKTVKFKRTGQPIKIKKIENYDGTPVIVGEYEINGKTESNRFRMDEISTDSAPRVLTGDCKIRVRKSK